MSEEKNLLEGLDLDTTEEADGSKETPPVPAKRYDRKFEQSFSSAEVICQKDLDPIKFFVDGILPAGFVTFAGNPKSGKSWQALQLAISIANGEPFLGRKTRKANVLYLDLEGCEQMTQKRFKLLNLTPPPNLYIAYYCKTFEGEMVTMRDNTLIDFLEEARDLMQAEVIIIDTLIRIKGGEKRNLNSYENDSKIFGALQQFAISNGICVIGITHLHKTNNHFEGSDWFERVTGSMGLVGISDTVWGLFKKGRSKNERDALFRVSGRYTPDYDCILHQDEFNCRWVSVSDDPELYEIKNHPFAKYLELVGDLSGRAGDITPKYLKYCKARRFDPCISLYSDDGMKADEETLSKRWSQMIRGLKDSLPLIGYEYGTQSTSKGTVYTFSRYNSDENADDDDFV